jgi:hypothetical protein
MLLAAAALVLTLSSPIASASSVRAPTPAAATSAFGRLLHERYGRSAAGFWTCPRAQVINGRIDCLAEVGAGDTWHQTSASARLVGGGVTFTHVYDVAWTRHWWPYSRRFIVRSHEDVPGVISVNSPAYDWGFLAQEVRGLAPGHTVRADAHDGNGGGWFRFYHFTCSARAGLITCANKLGDVMRYRP